MPEAVLKTTVRVSNIRQGPSTRNFMQLRPRPCHHSRYMKLQLSKSQNMCPTTQALPPRLHNSIRRNKSTQLITIHLPKVLLLAGGGRFPRPLGRGKSDRNAAILILTKKDKGPFRKSFFSNLLF